MRKDCTASQIAMFAAERQQQLKPAAKERQREGGKTAGRGRPKQDEKVPAALPEPKETRDQAAEQFGIGARTVNKAANVLEGGCERNTVSAFAP